MSCPVPKRPLATRPRVDVLAYTVHPLAHSAEAERLADALDEESRTLALNREELVTVTRERDEARGHLDALRKEILQHDMPAVDASDALESLRQLFAEYRTLLMECRTAKLNAGQARVRADLAEAHNAQLLQSLDTAGHSLSLPEGISVAQGVLLNASREPHPGRALLVEVWRLRDAAREVLRVVGTPTTLEQQKAHLGELRAALAGLRAALPVREGEVVRHG